MQTLPITLVAGPPGAGKTTWIRQQVDTLAPFTVYANLGWGETSIDATYLATEVPNLTVLPASQLVDFLSHLPDGCTVYIELGFHIELTSLCLPDNTQYDRVAILPPGTRSTEWHEWADLVVTGSKLGIALHTPQLWRSVLTGQVFDPASLNTFWYELTKGAYGNVQRVKGVFDVADGRSLYFDFVAGLPEIPDIELNVPLWLTGRPTRFSGIEVMGETLSQDAIAQTLEDCCLGDQAIAYYQQQIQGLMSE